MVLRELLTFDGLNELRYSIGEPTSATHPLPDRVLP